MHITAKELVPVVIAAALWGRYWSRQCVRSVQVRHHGSSSPSENMRLKRQASNTSPSLFLILLCHLSLSQFTAEYLPDVRNTAADVISCNNLSLFLSLVPQSQQVSIPPPVTDLLVTSRPDWGSQVWTRLFLTSLTRESPQQLELPISQAGGDT